MPQGADKAYLVNQPSQHPNQGNIFYHPDPTEVNDQCELTTTHVKTEGQETASGGNFQPLPSQTTNKSHNME